MAHTFTEDDEGKTVVNDEGEEVGMIATVEHGTAHVNPDPGLTDTIKSTLGWGDSDDEDTYPLQEESVASVTDDEVHLGSSSPTDAGGAGAAGTTGTADTTDTSTTGSDTGDMRSDDDDDGLLGDDDDSRGDDDGLLDDDDDSRRDDDDDGLLGDDDDSRGDDDDGLMHDDDDTRR